MPIALFQSPHLDSVQSLLDALLPLQTWATKNEYPPVQKPWEVANPATGAILNAKNLKLGEYIDQLAEDESKGQPFYAGQQNAGGDADLVKRFREVLADPLQAAADALGVTPQEVQVSRQLRSLNSELRFSPAVSDNVPVALPDDLHWLRPFSRKEIYDRVSVPFEASITAWKASLPSAPSVKDWEDYAQKLMSLRAVDHKAIHWPHDSPIEPQEFGLQLLRDALVGLMNMDSRRNLSVFGAQESDYRDAILIELGEQRRPGNAHTDQKAVKTVSAFMKELTKTLGGPVTSPALPQA